MTYSVLNAPSWLEFNTTTLEFSGTPGPGSQNTTTVTLVVADDVGSLLAIGGVAIGAACATALGVTGAGLVEANFYLVIR